MSLLRGRPVERLALGLGLEPAEGRGLLLMCALVAVLLCAYTIAKPRTKIISELYDFATDFGTEFIQF